MRGRPLQTTVVTLVALGVIALAVGTLATLSLTGTLRSSLAAIGPGGICGLAAAAILLPAYGAALHNFSRIRTDQVILNRDQECLLGQWAVRKLDAKNEERQIARLNDNKSPKSILKIRFPSKIKRYVFLNYQRPVDQDLVYWSELKTLAPEHMLFPIERIDVNGYPLVVYAEDPVAQSPNVNDLDYQRDLYFQAFADDRLLPTFQCLLRFMCDHNIHIDSLETCLPLSPTWKVTPLRLQHRGSLQENVQELVDQLPARWHPHLKGVLHEKNRNLMALNISSDKAQQRDEKNAQFAAFLSKKGIASVKERLKGQVEDGTLELICGLINAKLHEAKSTIPVLGRRVVVKTGKDSLDQLKKLGVIFDFEYYAPEKFLVYC